MKQEIIAPPNLTQLVTLQELARILRVSEPTIFRLIRQKANPLPSIKVGHNRRFNSDAVQAWLSTPRKVIA